MNLNFKIFLFILVQFALSVQLNAQQVLFAEGKTLYSWNPLAEENYTALFNSKAAIIDLKYEPRLNSIIISDAESKLYILDAQSFDLKKTLPIGYNNSLPIISPSGNYFIIKNNNGAALYQTEGYQLLRTIKLSDDYIEKIMFGKTDLDLFVLEKDEFYTYSLATRMKSTKILLPEFNGIEVMHTADGEELFINSSFSTGEYGYTRILLNSLTFSQFKTIELGLPQMSGFRIEPLKAASGQFWFKTYDELFIVDTVLNTSTRVLSDSIQMTDFAHYENNLVALFQQQYVVTKENRPKGLIVFKNSAGEIKKLEFKTDELLDKIAIIPKMDVVFSKIQDPNKIELRIQKEIRNDEIIFSDKGNLFVTIDGSLLTIWDERSLRQLRTIDCKVSSFNKGHIQILENKNQIACQCDRDNYDKSIEVFDISTGKIVKEIPFEGMFEGFDFESEQIFTSVDKSIANYELAIVPFADEKDTIKTHQDLNNVVYYKDQNVLLGALNDNEIGLYNLKTQKVEFSMKRNKKHNYFANYKLSSDGTKLMVIYPWVQDPTFKTFGVHPVEVIDIATSKVVLKLELMFGFEEICFSKDSKSIYYIADDTLIAPNGYFYLALIQQDINEIAIKSVISKWEIDMVSGSNTFAINPQNERVLVTINSNIRSLDLNTGRLIRNSPETMENQWSDLDYFDNYSKALLLTGQAVHLLDFENPHKTSVFYPSSDSCRIRGLANDSYWFEDDQSLSTEDKTNFQIVYKLHNVLNQSEVIEIPISNQIVQNMHVLKNGEHCILNTYHDNSPHWLLYDLKKKIILDEFSGKKNTTTVFEVPEIFISDDEKLLYTHYSGANIPTEVTILEISDKFRVQNKLSDVKCVYPTKDPNFVIKATYDENYQSYTDLSLFNLKEGKDEHIIAEDLDYGNATVSEDGKFVFYSTVSGVYSYPIFLNNELEHFNTHDFLSSVSLNTIPGLLILQNYNEYEFYDIQTMQKRYSLLASSDNSVFIKNKEGYYFSMKGGKNEYISFVNGNKAYQFDQFDAVYNRPDLVLKTLNKSNDAIIQTYYDSYKKRLRKLGVSDSLLKAQSNVPLLEITNLLKLPQITTNDKVTIDVNAKDSIFNIDKIHVWINNVPLYGLKGKSVPTGKKDISLSSDILLSEGDNLIQISCVNEKGIESMRESVRLNYSGELPPPITHFIGIGIDQFKEPGHNLAYSVKDIRDLADRLKEKLGDKLIIDTLFNENVSVENVEKLKKRLLISGINDKIIVAYSGHGLLSAEYDYYLSSYLVDFKNPEMGGIPYEILADLLDSIPARKKLLLIDACHSGEVDKDELIVSTEKSIEGEKDGNNKVKMKLGKVGLTNSFQLMQDVFTDVQRGSGATVISAAGGDQSALEGGGLKNGYFTYAILQLLNAKKSITVNELKTNVLKDVLILSNGKQKPTSRAENLELDWEVW